MDGRLVYTHPYSWVSGHHSDTQTLENHMSAGHENVFCQGKSKIPIFMLEIIQCNLNAWKLMQDALHFFLNFFCLWLSDHILVFFEKWDPKIYDCLI